jgi:hypothetical protein
MPSSSKSSSWSTRSRSERPVPLYDAHTLADEGDTASLEHAL